MEVQKRYLKDYAEQTKLQEKQKKPNPLTNFKVTMALENQSETLAEKALVERKLEKIRRQAPETNNLASQLRAIQRHPFIEKVDFVTWGNIVSWSNEPIIEKYVIVDTKEIKTTYRDINGDEQRINMGAYQLAWKLGELGPKIKSLSFSDGEVDNPHPCVARWTFIQNQPRAIQGGAVCLGTFDEPVRVNAVARRFDLVLDTYIHFLMTLNSGNPHRDINDLVPQIRRVAGLEQQESATRESATLENNEPVTV
jgi:hypothetical protein